MTETMTMGVGQRADRNSAIANALRSFAEVRGATMRMVAGLTSDQASFTPGAGGWSVAQNLDHLLLTEALYRGQIRKLLDLAREGKKTNIDVSLGEVDLSLPFVPKMMMPLMAVPLTMMNMFVPSALRETVLRFPIMKAKNPRISEPAKGKPVADLREQLQAAMEETEAMLSGELPTSGPAHSRLCSVRTPDGSLSLSTHSPVVRQTARHRSPPAPTATPSAVPRSASTSPAQRSWGSSPS